MLHVIKNQVLLVLGAILLVPLSFAESKGPCKGNPHQVAPCFTVRGRLTIYLGSPSARIWRIGTKRILGISERYAQVRQMPESLEEKLKPGVAIYGDFEVCPFTKDRPGQMQLVCIESASNLVVKKANDPEPQSKGSSTVDCGL